MLSKSRMIAVLLPSAAGARGHLQMAILVRTNPDLGPRRRDYERFESYENLGRANDLAVGIHIRESATVPVPADSRHRIGDIAKSRGARGLLVLLRYRLSQLVLLKRAWYTRLRRGPESGGVVYGRKSFVPATPGRPEHVLGPA